VRRPILLLSALATLAASALTPLVTTASAHEARYPVVLMHGWTGQGSSWNPMIPKLQAQGMTVLDFDPTVAGVQAMSYSPSAGQHIPLLAKQVQSKIQTALANNGYASTQKVDIVAHSMGGAGQPLSRREGWRRRRQLVLDHRLVRRRRGRHPH